MLLKPIKKFKLSQLQRTLLKLPVNQFPLHQLVLRILQIKLMNLFSRQSQIRVKLNSQIKKNSKELRKMMMLMMKMLLLLKNNWSKLPRKRLNIRNKKLLKLPPHLLLTKTRFLELLMKPLPVEWCLFKLMIQRTPLHQSIKVLLNHKTGIKLLTPGLPKNQKISQHQSTKA